ncbi:hypothetical protein ACN079_01850 [Pseudomonas sp. ABY48]|nr:hypothetical protein [Pseudomonas brassicacearum]CAH0149046.1 hypothetical protein SRABI06_00660 [Pseudomonas brassicacearum]
MGYIASVMVNDLSELSNDRDNPDVLAPEQLLEGLQLSPAEKAELDAE